MNPIAKKGPNGRIFPPSLPSLSVNLATGKPITNARIAPKKIPRANNLHPNKRDIAPKLYAQIGAVAMVEPADMARDVKAR